MNETIIEVEKPTLARRIRQLFGVKNGEASLREAIEEYMEETMEDGDDPISSHEKLLISNVLQLRDLTVVDVMIPRVDIIAVDETVSDTDLKELLTQAKHSRIPVYRETLDDVTGTIHIKDILAAFLNGKKYKVKDNVRPVPIVSPAMPVLDLLLQMRQTKKHMALVVDEFGGIDGLVTINDLVEAIVGEIDDEYDIDDQPNLYETPDGALIADGRFDLEDFCAQYGDLFSESEIEDNDTLAGVVGSIAGRVPARGEVIEHESGLVFEIVEADPRRISCLKIRNLETALRNHDDAQTTS